MTRATPSCPRPRSAGCRRTGDDSATRNGITSPGNSATGTRRNFLLVDGRLVRRAQLPVPGTASTRIIVNDAERSDIPFQVGGFLRPEHRAGWTPGDFGMTMFNLEGEIDELRISKVMRYPVADRLTIIRQKLPEAGLNLPYVVPLGADAAAGSVSWKLAAGSLPAGLSLDARDGTIRGTPEQTVAEQEFTVRAHDEAGATDAHTFRLAVERGRLVTHWLPPAFADAPYSVALTAEHMAGPLAWEVVSGTLPEGVSLDAKTGCLAGTAVGKGGSELAVRVTDAAGLQDRAELTLKVLPAALRGARWRRAHRGALRLAGTERPADPGTRQPCPGTGAHLHQYGRGSAGLLAGPGREVPAGDRARRATATRS